MTFISGTTFTPIPGKTALSHERIRRLGEIIARAGGRTRIAAVAWGDGARNIHLYGVSPTMKASAETWAAVNADPAFTALRAESEKEPASHWVGPEVWRCVFGEPQPNFPVLLQREYEMDRRHLKALIGLMSEAQALQGDRPALAVVPALSGDMARFMVAYYATSLVDAGDRMDRIGGSEAFQALLVRAAEYGRVTKARLLVNI
jgi:hypothetical protein